MYLLDSYAPFTLTYIEDTQFVSRSQHYYPASSSLSSSFYSYYPPPHTFIINCINDLALTISVKTPQPTAYSSTRIHILTHPLTTDAPLIASVNSLKRVNT